MFTELLDQVWDKTESARSACKKQRLWGSYTFLQVRIKVIQSALQTTFYNRNEKAEMLI